MNGFISKVDHFKSLDTSSIMHYLKFNNPNVDNSIVRSWENLINDIKRSQTFRNLNSDLVIGIEFNVFVDDMGVDLFLYGEYNGKNIMYILEAKQWDDEYILNNNFGNYREKDKILLPQNQIKKHNVAIKYYLNIGEKIDEIIPFVYINNSTQNGLKKIMSYGNTDGINFTNNLDEFFNVIKKLQKGSLTQEDFKNVEYQPSHDIITAMGNLIKTENTFILTDEQTKVVNEIIKHINEGKRIIQITGSAGSGKTAILVNLYLRLLRKMNKSNIKPFFSSGSQNTHLYRSLYPEIEDLFCWTFTLSKNIINTQKRILLLDEAQSNKNGILMDLLCSGSIIIFCYDENQIINYNNSLFELDIIKNSEKYVEVKLNNCVRYNGSQVFEKNIKKLVYGSENDYIKDDKYYFEIAKTKEEFINKLKSIYKENVNKTISLSGLLCKNANIISEEFKDLFFINWDSKKEKEWVPYIRKKDYKTQFDGKIWLGTWWQPGIDVDYNIVIIGNDAIKTENGIKVKPENSMLYNAINSALDFTSIPEEIRKTGVCQNLETFLKFGREENNKKYYEEFINKVTTLIRNNYYIMFTRGRKGCLIYFTEEENNF